MNTPEIHWERMTSPMIAAAAQKNAVVVVPVGSIEQHGPHLPTMTDSACVEHLVERAAGLLAPGEFIVAPGVRYGYSHDHLGFAGTLSISARLLEEMLVEIAASVVLSGFDRIAFVNGHGSNASLLYYVVRRVRDAAPRAVSVTGATYWTLAREALSDARRSAIGGMGHACELETSLMLQFEPDMVDMDRAVREMPEPYSRFRSSDLLSPGPAVAPDRFKVRTESGVSGDPLVATAEHGAHMADIIVRALADFLGDFATWELAPQQGGAPSGTPEEMR
jgi:creatinine amidohydrolase